MALSHAADKVEGTEAEAYSNFRTRVFTLLGASYLLLALFLL